MAETYAVVGQKQSIDINPAGNGFDDVWEITYRVTSGASKGTVATVTVPDSDHNPAAVDAAIRAKLDDLHGIAALGSKPHSQ